MSHFRSKLKNVYRLFQRLKGLLSRQFVSNGPSFEQRIISYLILVKPQYNEKFKKIISQIKATQKLFIIKR